MWNSLVHFEEDGLSRIQIYEQGWNLFVSRPIFGTGFYSGKIFEWTQNSLIIPPRWHNTYIQLLASCGILGLLAYLFHRVQTVWLVLKKPTIEKLFLALGIVGLIGTSILDCHFFNVGPGFIYSVFLVFIERQAEMKERL